MTNTVIKRTLLATTLCMSCATPYQPKGITGGYTSQSAGANTHYVSYEGNGYTPITTVTEHWLRRASEICGGDTRYTILSVQQYEDSAQIGNDTYEVSGQTITHKKAMVFKKYRVEGYIRCL